MPKNDVKNKSDFYPKYFFIGAIFSLLTIYFFGANEKTAYVVRTLIICYVGAISAFIFFLRAIGVIDINDKKYKIEKPLFIKIISKSVIFFIGHGLGFFLLYLFFYTK